MIDFLHSLLNEFRLNLVLAIVATVVMVFTLMVVQEAPPTPPSRAGLRKKGPSLWKGTKLMFTHRNYTQICIADFIMSGPPQVLFATLSRIFPPSVENLSTDGKIIKLL